ARRHSLSSPTRRSSDLWLTLQEKIVQVRALVLRQIETDTTHVTLDLSVDGVTVVGQLLVEPDAPVPQLQGAYVEFAGIYVHEPDAQGRIKQITLWVLRTDQVKVVGFLATDPRFERPVVSVDSLATVGTGELVRVVGEVRAQERGESFIVRDATGQVRVRSNQLDVLAQGTPVEALGHVQPGEGGWILDRALVRPMMSGEVRSPTVGCTRAQGRERVTDDVG